MLLRFIIHDVSLVLVHVSLPFVARESKSSWARWDVWLSFDAEKMCSVFEEKKCRKFLFSLDSRSASGQALINSFISTELWEVYFVMKFLNLHRDHHTRKAILFCNPIKVTPFSLPLLNKNLKFPRKNILRQNFFSKSNLCILN